MIELMLPKEAQVRVSLMVAFAVETFECVGA